jgi:hypothetical protein
MCHLPEFDAYAEAKPSAPSKTKSAGVGNPFVFTEKFSGKIGSIPR